MTQKIMYIKNNPFDLRDINELLEDDWEVVSIKPIVQTVSGNSYRESEIGAFVLLQKQDTDYTYYLGGGYNFGTYNQTERSTQTSGGQI